MSLSWDGKRDSFERSAKKNAVSGFARVKRVRKAHFKKRPSKVVGPPQK